MTCNKGYSAGMKLTVATMQPFGLCCNKSSTKAQICFVYASEFMVEILTGCLHLPVFTGVEFLSPSRLSSFSLLVCSIFECLAAFGHHVFLSLPLAPSVCHLSLLKI